MSFNKRSISDEKVLEVYRESGVDGVWKLYSSKVDAFFLSGKLAKKCYQDVEAGSYTALEETLNSWDI